MSPRRPQKRGNYSKIAFLSPFITLIIHRRGDFLQAQRGNVSFPTSRKDGGSVNQRRRRQQKSHVITTVVCGESCSHLHSDPADQPPHASNTPQKRQGSGHFHLLITQSSPETDTLNLRFHLSKCLLDYVPKIRTKRAARKDFFLQLVCLKDSS